MDKFNIVSKKRRQYFVLALLVLGVIASTVHFQIMQYGPGMTGDSIIYLQASSNLKKGVGLVFDGEPLITYPPVYPGILSLVSYLTKGDVFLSAKILSAIVLGLNLVLFTTAILLSTDWNLLAAGSAILVFLLSEQILMTHSMVWSESLFISFLLITLMLLSQYLKKPAYQSLLLMSFVIVFAVLTRYAGVTLLLPVVASMIYFGDRPFKQKLKDIVVVILFTVLPLGAWILRNYILTSSTTDHPFAVHLINRGHIQKLIETFHDFTLPISTSIWHKMIHLLVISSIFVVFFIFVQKKDYLDRSSFSRNQTLFISSIVFSIGYILFLLTSISFFDVSLEVNTRLLFPALMGVSLAWFPLVWHFSKTQGQISIWYCFILFILLSVSIKSNFSIEAAIKLHDSGRGYSARYWRESETIQVLKNMTDDRKIYSNGPDVIWFLLDQETNIIPKKLSRMTREPNEQYEEQLDKIIDEVNNKTARVVYFTRLKQWELPTLEEINPDGKLPLFEVYEDGVIFAIP